MECIYNIYIIFNSYNLDTFRNKSNQLPSHNLPLNVEGQVNLLINEAKKPENLYKMYMGWMPFL